MNPIFNIEERTMNAWPALQTRHVDGLLLRSALGHTKRANAATALYSSTISMEELAIIVKDHYRAMKITPMFRITPLSPVGLDEYLEKAGWVLHEPSYGLEYDIPTRLEKGGNREAMVTLEEEPSPAWVEGAAKAYELQEWQQEALWHIVSSIQVKRAFCTLFLDKEPVAFGLGTCERGYVGLHDLAVKREFRSLGLGERMIKSLFHWGKSHGGERAFLQVREANSGARKLYARLGFREVYLYHHRVWANSQ
jgi:N-acetylglutamate synthase